MTVDKTRGVDAEDICINVVRDLSQEANSLYHMFKKDDASDPDFTVDMDKLTDAQKDQLCEQLAYASWDLDQIRNKLKGLPMSK